MNELEELQRRQMELYLLCREGILSLEEYLMLMRSLDRKITELELSFLPDTAPGQQASCENTPKP